MTTADQYADEIMVEIHDDMRAGFPWSKTIPADVGSFSCLHDYVDANCYLDSIPQGTQSWDLYTDLCNEVSDLVDRRLAAEALALDTGDRCPCGRLARFVSGHVSHIDGDRSHACEPCQFCVCPACHLPLEDRGPFDGTEPSSGVRNGYVGFGLTLMCAQGHWWTWLQGGLIGPDRVLTIIERGTTP